MRFIAHLLAVSLILSTFACCLAGEIKLPQPKKTGGPALFEAIDARGSAVQANFPAGKVGEEDLATILWAATGLNRDGTKWTVPMGMGRPPYCKLYIAAEDGAYLYDWKSHSLQQVTTNDIRSAVAMQDFAKKAPQILVFVTDGAALGAMPNPVFANEFGLVLVGAMSQDIYLAAGALNVGTRMIYSVNRDDTAKLLGLPAGDKVICIMPIGKK